MFLTIKINFRFGVVLILVRNVGLSLSFLGAPVYDETGRTHAAPTFGNSS